MKTLITGATGLLGNNLVRTLLEQGQPVRVLVREKSDPRPLAGLDVERALGDIQDAESVRRACQGVDAVVHSAADVHIGWTRLKEMRAINVEGTRNVLNAARENGAKMVYVSSINALAVGTREEPSNEETPIHGNIRCGYVVTKQEAEQLVRQYVKDGLHAMIVNPGFMLGPWDWKPSSGRMLLGVAKHFLPLVPWGGVTVGDVRDVSAAIVKALEVGQSGRQYLLGGHNLPYLEIWQEFSRITGGHPPLMRMGPLQRVILGTCGDIFAKITRHETPVNSAALRMAAQFHYYDSTRAQKELGYRIRPAEETALDAWRWLLEHGLA